MPVPPSEIAARDGDDRDGQRLLHGRAFADGKRQGEQRQDGRQGRHRDRPQAIAAGFAVAGKRTYVADHVSAMPWL
jgi:hypothetical protein